MTLNQRLGYVFGGVYVLVGFLGFVVTAGVGFVEPDGGLLLGIFEVNPLHNIVHLLVGTALAGAAALGAVVSRGVNLVVGAVYLLVGIVGVLVPADSALNILALNGSDHLLHFASAALLLGVGLKDRAQAAPRRQSSHV